MLGSGHISCLIDSDPVNVKVAEKKRPIRFRHLNVQKAGFLGGKLPPRRLLNRESG